MRGFCFLGRPDGKAGKRHLKIILTEPNSNGQVVVASVATLRDPGIQDTACTLAAGDHPFIKYASFVDIDRPTVQLWLDIANGLNSGELMRKEELAPDVFGRVLQAAKSSQKMHRRIKSMLFSSL